MDSLLTVLLKPGEADRVVAGHPWIYHGSILRLTHPARDGDLVQVKDHRQRFLGVGFFNSKSKIHVRMLAPERVTVDEAFFDQAIRTAIAIRNKHLPDATSFRVVNAESDFLSGLVVDKYEDVLVLQTSSLGMDQRKPMIIAALQRIFSPRAILERNDISSRKFEGLPDANGVITGRFDGRLTVQLNRLQFEVDLLGGQKTGLYLDQQVNYQRVGGLIARSPDAQVLDCFSFAGGFALHAARAGAAHVHAIDQSEEAVAAGPETPRPTVSRRNVRSRQRMFLTGSRRKRWRSRMKKSFRVSTASFSTRRRSRAIGPPCPTRCAAIRKFICAR